MRDQSIRQQALDPKQSFIVQAPAGSGKTQLLTSRLLSLLAHRSPTPESVLAITFTRKAAQEMKRRVMNALQLAQGPEPAQEHERSLWQLAKGVLDKDQQYGWGLLMNPQRLRIMTIDALCSSITHQLPLSSRLGAQPQCVEYAHTRYVQAAQATLRQLICARHGAVKTLLLHLNNRQTWACHMIAQMLSSREQWFGLLYSQDQADLDQLRDTLETSIAHIVHQTFEQSMADLWGADWDGLALYLDFAATNIDLPAFNRLSADVDNIDDWQAIAKWMCTLDGEIRKTVDKRQGFPASKDSTNNKAMKEGFIAWLDHLREDEKACAALKTLLSLPTPQYADRQWDVLKALFEVLPKAVEQLYVLFESRGETDFNAIARCALTALGDEENPTDLDLKLDHTIHHVLVDEFQDTSAMQFELIRRLVSHWDNSGEKTLFVVGDPMQSIYGFRQAEVAGFMQAQAYGIGPIRLTSLQLQSNFRSDKPIIDWINEGMNRIDFGSIQYASFEAQLPAQAHSGVFPQWVSDAQGLNEAMVSTLKRLIDDQAIQSIAILVRQRNHIEAIMPALRRANIPYQAVEIEKITLTPCIRQLLQLTRAYLNKADSQAWLSVLMSPYCGLSLSDLTYLREHASLYADALMDHSHIAVISTEGRAILNRVAPILSDGLLHKHRLPLAQAIEGLWYALGGPAALSSSSESSDAEAFFDLLNTCDNGGSLDLVDFEQRLARLFSQASASAKIQIMTIHRAKGLEFDAVLIPSLERQPKASEKPLLLWEMCPVDQSNVLLFAPIHAVQADHDPLYEFLWRKQKTRGRHEHARLLYVALTRAKKQLYLFAEKTKARPDSFLNLLQTAFNMLPEPELQRVESQVQANNTPLILHRLEPHWQHPCLEQLLQAQHSAHLQTDNPVDHDAILPTRYHHKTLGTIIHHILFHWAENPSLITHPMSFHESHWTSLLQENGLSILHLTWINEVMRRVQRDPQAQYLLAPHRDARHEYEINTLEEGHVNTLIIDNTFIDDQGVRVIVDYKTGELNQKKHWVQLERYARVLSKEGQVAIRLCLYCPVTGEYLEKLWSPHKFHHT